MKKYKYLVYMGLILLMSACSDFLETSPKNGIISDASFFKTTEDFDMFMMGAYIQVAGGLNSGVDGWIVLTNFINQDATAPDGIPKPLEQYMNASEGRIASFWTDCYGLNSKANQVLAKLPDAEIPDADKTRLEAEARFFRGFAYFYLGAAFGGVPLILEPFNMDQAFMESSSEDAIWDQAIADLTAAATTLPANYENKNVGRVTKGAAYAYLANAYMYKNDWPKAETACNSLESLGIYDLMPTVRSVFSLANQQDNVEFIYAVKYRDVSDGKINWGGHEAGTLLPTYTSPRNIGNEWAPAAGWGEVSMNRKLADSFEPGDDRRKNLIVSPGEKYKGETMSDSCLVPEWAAFENLSFSTKYWLGPPTTEGANYIHQNDIPVMRYAEFVLNYAEILFMNGKTTEAYAQLNRIRERALLPDAPESTDQAVFMDVLMKERRAELNFESNLWFHFTRTGTAAKYLQEEHGVSWNSAWSKFPIPQTERDVNQNLGQNDGY